MDAETPTFCCLYQEDIDDSLYESILNECSTLDKNEKYYIKTNTTNNEKNILQSYVIDLVDHHKKKNNIPENVKIEYSLLEYSEDLSLEIHDDNDNNDEKEIAPLLSIISFIKVENHCMLFTNVNMESYKYKEIYNDDNVYAIVVPNNKTHVVFDGSMLYGFFDIQKKYAADKDENNNSNNSNEEFLYLKINVWQDVTTAESCAESPEETKITPLKNSISTADEFSSKLPVTDLYEAPRRGADSNFHWYKITHNEKNVLKCKHHITNSEIHENIIYNTNDETTISTIYTILKNFFTELHQVKNKIICLTLSSNAKTNLNFLLSQYGDIINDLMELSNNRTITEKNRFHQNKNIPRILSIDVCHWIINEIEKNDNWVESPYKNYEYNIKAENIPHVFNFLIFVSNYWLTYFKDLYNVPEKMKINIEDMFVAKNTSNSYKKKSENIENVKNNYFICNIQINDITRFTGGEIYFDNSEEKMKINQGDLLIFNSSKTPKYNELEDGVSYNLVLVIEFILQS